MTNDYLEARYRPTRDRVEHNRWQMLWLLARGMTATSAANVTGYSAYWIGQIARQYNRDGPKGVRDRRHRAGERHLLLSEAQRMDQRAALTAPHPEGDRWCGCTVAA